jgi:hypothetical protein
MSAIAALATAPGEAARDEVIAAVVSGQSTDSVPAEAVATPIEAAPAETAKPAEAAAPPGALPLEAEDAAQRHKALTVARIRLSKAPVALKERFATLAEEAGDAAAVEACLKAVEESLPEFLTRKPGDAARPEHPAGEVFFRGSSEEITDAQAEEIAQRQLARSGLLRGQRVRMAD